MVILFPLMDVSDWQPSDRARRMAAALSRAIKSCKPLKVAAEEMRYTQPQLSMLLNVSRPSLLTKLADLGPDVARAFLSEWAPEEGMAVLDQEKAALLEEVKQLRMARMDPPQKKRTA